MLQKLQDSGHMKDADKSYIGGKTVHGYWFDYDKLKIDLMSVIDYWQAQDRRYAPKQAEKGKESMESKEFNFESQKDEKPTNHPKTDDLPF